MQADRERVEHPEKKPPNRFSLGLGLLISLVIHLLILSSHPQPTVPEKQRIVLSIRHLPPPLLSSTPTTQSQTDTPPVVRNADSRAASEPEAGPPEAVFLSPELLSKRPLALADLNSKEIDELPGELAGSARLHLWINASGQVVNVTQEDGNLPDEIVALLEQSFRQLPFSPGEIDGRPVASRMTLEVSIAPEIRRR